MFRDFVKKSNEIKMFKIGPKVYKMLPVQLNITEDLP